MINFPSRNFSAWNLRAALLGVGSKIALPDGFPVPMRAHFPSMKIILPALVALLLPTWAGRVPKGIIHIVTGGGASLYNAKDFDATVAKLQKDNPGNYVPLTAKYIGTDTRFRSSS